MLLPQAFEPGLEPLDRERELDRPRAVLRDLGSRRQRVEGDVANTGKIVAQQRQRELGVGNDARDRSRRPVGPL